MIHHLTPQTDTPVSERREHPDTAPSAVQPRNFSFGIGEGFPKLIPWFAPKMTIAQAAMPYPDNPAHLTRLLAARLRARRIELGLPREELAERANLAPATIKAFERTGKISLERFLTLTEALGRYDELVYLFERRAPDSAHVIGRRHDRRTRGRRTRRDARPRDRAGTATTPPPR